MQGKVYTDKLLRDCVRKARRQQESVVTGFICGMPRAATNWMSDCLESHSEVAVFGETGFWGKHYINSVDTYGSKEAEELLDRQLSIRSASLERKSIKANAVIREIQASIRDEDLSLSPKELFDWIVASIGYASEKDKVIERTPHHINWIDRIASNYPEAKYIVMTRDPYDFMLSYKHQGDRKPPHVRETFRRLYHPAGCATSYRRYMRAIRYAQTKYSDRVLVVSFSRVKNEPRKVLEEVQTFLGLDRVEDILVPKTNTSFPGGNRPQLSDIDIWWMNVIAGSYIKGMGTRLKHASPAFSDVFLSVGQLPIWAFRVMRHFRKDRMASAWTYIWRLLS